MDIYACFGRIHAGLITLRREGGQGTVEYVGLILLMAVVLAGIVKAAGSFTDDQGVAKAVVDKLQKAISGIKGD